MGKSHPAFLNIKDMQANKRMRLGSRLRRAPKWVRILVITLASLIFLWVLLLSGLALYISRNADSLLPRITKRISTQISGMLEIESMEPALFKGFPNISVRLKNVRLTDSLILQHQLPMIQLEELYIQFNLWSVFSRHPEVRQVTAAGGAINLFKLKDGYSNLYLFKGDDTGKQGSKKDKSLYLQNVSLEQVTFTFYHFQYNKEFKVHFDKLQAWIKPGDTRWDIRLDLDALIHQLGFNLAKGAYLKNSEIKGKLSLQYFPAHKQLKVLQKPLRLDRIPVVVGGAFDFGKTPAVFNLDIRAESIDFQKGIHLLTPNISRELEIISLEDPIAVNALLQGSFQYPDTPYVHVYIEVENNTLNTPFGQLENANFKPEFHNNIVPGKGRGDGNSAIIIPKFTGSWQGLPVQADSTYVYSLVHPQLRTRVRSRFEVTRLNRLSGNTLKFTSGEAHFDLAYSGPVVPDDIQVNRQLDGYFEVENAAFQYLPRTLNFKDGRLRLDFKGEDVFWNDIQLTVGGTRLQLSGQAVRFLNAYFNDPAKAVIETSVRSRHVDLNAFRSFLYSRSASRPTDRKTNFKAINSNLDRVLEKSTMILRTNIDQVDYRKFRASDIKGTVTLQESGIALSDVTLAHAGGQFALAAEIGQSSTRNPFRIQGKIRAVEIDQLFKAFENFGQDAIRSEHLEGQFTADLDLRGALDANGSFLERSMNGYVDFKLREGAILNFPPFVSISKFIFKKRNLDSITFKTIADRLDIDQGKIIIHPLQIESSAITMNIEGVYGLDGGTDIAIAIPLKNPEKIREQALSGRRNRKNQGLTLHLRAKDDAKGNVKISWDPLKKGSEADSVFSEKDLQELDNETIKLN